MPAFAHLNQLHQTDNHNRRNQDVGPPIFVGEPSADRQQHLGHAGQIGFEVAENTFEFRDHDDHDQRDHAHGDADHDCRVNHGADDLFLQLRGFFHEIGEARQDQIEHTAHLAGVDHVHIKLVKGLGEFGHGIGERPTAFDFVRHAADDRFEKSGFLLVFQNLQAAQDRQTRRPAAWRAAG